MARRHKAAYCPRRGHITNERVLRADKALGDLLPKGAQVFEHKDTLVICQDRKYHALLTQRAKSLEMTGAAEKLHCHLCGKYDDAENLHIGEKARYHKECHYFYSKERYNTGFMLTNLYCSKGHWKDGQRGRQRYCKQCANEYAREWNKRKKEAK